MNLLVMSAGGLQHFSNNMNNTFLSICSLTVPVMTFVIKLLTAVSLLDDGPGTKKLEQSPSSL